MPTAIIFDSETNDRDNPEIIEAAWIDLIFGNPTTIDPAFAGGPAWQRFQPTRPITLGAMATHGILDEDLVGADPSATCEIPPCDYIVGANIDFDWQAAGSPEGPKRIDTCALARLVWPSLDCYSQSALIYYLDRQNARERLKGAHGAAADCLLCKTILDAIIRETGSDSWEDLWRRSEDARIPRVMMFGKHKGTAIKDLPHDYKAWLLRATDPPICPYLRKALLGEAAQRTLFCPQ